MVGSIIGAGASLLGGFLGKDAAKDAAAQQKKWIDRGLAESGTLYNTAQNYLAPFIQSGQGANTLLNDILGLNGPEAQQAALLKYQGSPSANLLKQVQEEALRRTAGQWAAEGGYKSGGMIQDLARRQSDIALGDYNNWQGLATGLLNVGANAAGSASNLAYNRGRDILGARTNQGTALASGTIGGANAMIGGLFGAGNYLTDFFSRGGSGSDLSTALGKGGAGMNFLNFFG